MCPPPSNLTQQARPSESHTNFTPEERVATSRSLLSRAFSSRPRIIRVLLCKLEQQGDYFPPLCPSDDELTTTTFRATCEKLLMSSRLTAFAELLPPDLLSQLLEKNIKTVADFISTPAADILRLLPRGTASLGEVNDCITRITAAFSVSEMNGEEAYEAEMERERQTGGEEVRSGVKELDDLLGGSFGGACGGRVVELSGESGHGTGKTALALHIVLSHLSAYKRASSVWLDTTGDLSAERITRTYSSQKGPAVHSALERFHISLAFDIDVAYQVLDGIRAALLHHQTVTADDQPRLRIVVIDTITPFLGPQLSAVTSQGHATMVTFMRSLRSLAQAHSLSIIVINTSSSANPYNPASVFSTTARKPALGPSFTFLTDATLWMAHPPALTPASTASDAASMAPEAATGPSDPGSLILSESPAWDNKLRVVEVFRSRVSVSALPVISALNSVGRSLLAIQHVVYNSIAQRNGHSFMIRLDQHSYFSLHARCREARAYDTVRWCGAYSERNCMILVQALDRCSQKLDAFQVQGR